MTNHLEHNHQPSAQQLAETSAEDVVQCPVMPGSTVIKADAEAADLYRDYQGKRYWFCCSACGPLFDADPERYVNAA